MKNNSINNILRESYSPGLPYGFAERIAQSVIGESIGGFWDFLLNLTPKTSLAFGAVATTLLVLGLTGSGIGIIDAIESYASINNLVPIL